MKFTAAIHFLKMGIVHYRYTSFGKKERYIQAEIPYKLERYRAILDKEFKHFVESFGPYKLKPFNVLKYTKFGKRPIQYEGYRYATMLVINLDDF